MKKKIYKNNVGCIIFMVLVYSEIMMESCLSYEKTVNDCRSFYEWAWKKSEKEFYSNEKKCAIMQSVPKKAVDSGGN